MNYVLYHGNCNDGFGAALAAWMAFEKTNHGTVYLPVLYGNPPPPMDQGNDVYILDFSYPAKTLLELAHLQTRVVVLDHHATAQRDLSLEAFCEALSIDKESLVKDALKPVDGMIHVRNISIFFDMQKSGAVLAWEYFHPDKQVPLLFLYLQDRDLWHFVLDRSRLVSAYMQTRTMDFGVWEYVMRELENTHDREEIFRAGAACLKLKEMMVDSMAQNAVMMIFDMSIDPPEIVFDVARTPGCGHWLVPVANATCFFSEVGERLLQMVPDAPFAAYYLDRADRKRQWGLRSRPEFDCSVIAKAFGGGGHKQAAGFTTDTWTP